MAEISAMGEIITCGSLIVPKSCDKFSYLAVPSLFRQKTSATS